MLEGSAADPLPLDPDPPPEPVETSDGSFGKPEQPMMKQWRPINAVRQARFLFFWLIRFPAANRGCRL
jgi:hypothetical protein